MSYLHCVHPKFCFRKRQSLILLNLSRGQKILILRLNRVPKHWSKAYHTFIFVLCDIICILGICNGYFMISSDFLTDLFRLKSIGVAPYQNILLDIPKKALAEVRDIVKLLLNFTLFFRLYSRFGDNMSIT